jgi:hypothetical protein
VFTESARDAQLIRDTVTDQSVRALLYQARVNLELFRHSRKELCDSLEKLDFENFARAFGTCHMTDGIFGDAKRTANMMMYKEQVLGFLLATVTAGHRFTRSLRGARSRERSTDWRAMRIDLSLLDRQYHDVRNFMEHLDEAIALGTVSEDTDCSFSRQSILTCRKGDTTLTFDFSTDALQKTDEVYENVLSLLRARQESAEPASGADG